MRQSLPQLLNSPTKDKYQLHWSLLPILCCGACGGETDEAVDISAAWLLFYVAAHIFDNVEDLDEPEAWYGEFGSGMALNTGCGLFFTASLALQGLFNEPGHKQAALEINRAFQEHMLVMSSGQHRDLTHPTINLDQYWQIAEGKSGAFFQLASWAGARLASEDTQRLEHFKQFGKRLGLLLQLLDDLTDIRPTNGSKLLPEPRELSHSFAIAYAMSVFPEAQQKNLQADLTQSAQHEQAAQRIILTLQNSGVDLYLLTEIERQRGLALQALNNANPESPYRELLRNLVPDLHTHS